jgi:hypothetical protein
MTLIVMIIGIDISQIVYEGTGVARYVTEMVRNLIATDKNNRYVLFGSSLRRRSTFISFYDSLPQESKTRAELKTVPFPPKMLHILWNVLHIFPVEWLVGSLDIFWSSDWTQPPLLRAKGITTIHDLTIYRYPESFSEEIIAVHKRKLAHSKKVCAAFLCDSETTKDDAITILKIPKEKLFVIYPGSGVTH